MVYSLVRQHRLLCLFVDSISVRTFFLLHGSNCLNELEFYGPVNAIKVILSWSVYLTTLLLGRLSPQSGKPLLCKNILTTDSPKSESIHRKNKSKQPCLSNKEKSDQGLHCLLFIQLLTVCIQILLHHSFSKGKVFKYCTWPNYYTYFCKCTVKHFHSFQGCCLWLWHSLNFSLIFFPYYSQCTFCLLKIKVYVVCTDLNCIDSSMQFKWVPTTYAFIKNICFYKENQTKNYKTLHKHHLMSPNFCFFKVYP